MAGGDELVALGLRTVERAGREARRRAPELAARSAGALGALERQVELGELREGAGAALEHARAVLERQVLAGRLAAPPSAEQLAKLVVQAVVDRAVARGGGR